MNKKGQTIFYGLMLCVVVIVLASGFAAPSLVATNSSMTEMNCSSTSDSYVKGACLITDLTSPYFIGAVICVGIAILGAKIAITGELIG